MWIQNVSLYEAINAHHYDPGENSVLIQIVDPDCDFPTCKYPFKEVSRFKFLDIEEEDSPHSISVKQAKEIAAVLEKAKEKRSNVVVHCHAGICRSGAVAECAIAALGFEDTETYRQPNTLVKRRILAALGYPLYQ